MRSLLDTIVVNWNSGNHFRKCFPSIIYFGCKDVSKVLVVGNGSGHDSADDLEEFGLPLQIMRNLWNLVPASEKLIRKDPGFMGLSIKL